MLRGYWLPDTLGDEPKLDVESPRDENCEGEHGGDNWDVKELYDHSCIGEHGGDWPFLGLELMLKLISFIDIPCISLLYESVNSFGLPILFSLVGSSTLIWSSAHKIARM